MDGHTDGSDRSPSGSEQIHRAHRLASSEGSGGVPAALSLVLLAASGLLTAALDHLENQDFGFAQDRRTIIRIDPSLVAYRPDQLTALYGRIKDSLSRVAGVSDVAICQYSPRSDNNWGAGVWVDGRPAPGPRDDVSTSWDRVTAGYFNAIGTPVIEGRGISDHDTGTSQRVAVINQAFARKFFKNEDPIEKYFGQTEMATPRQYEIVGVAQDARYLDFGLDKPISPFFICARSAA
jgi:MacB-like periplasmic core domain